MPNHQGTYLDTRPRDHHYAGRTLSSRGQRSICVDPTSMSRPRVFLDWLIKSGGMATGRVVVDHVLFVVADLDASRRLYTAALAPLGYEELYVQDDGLGYGAEGQDDFSITRGLPVTTAAHVAFSAEDRDAVDAFFAAAVANGATTRGEPGVWTQYSDRYYAAFVGDLHENNIEAVWHAPEPVADAPRRPGVP
jgi:catechol 2,3-dioxygenase-like lactoylglutathione lyase family enzyme